MHRNLLLLLLLILAGDAFAGGPYPAISGR
jgi:hypothetical protein